jgi:hypothetical protein
LNPGISDFGAAVVSSPIRASAYRTASSASRACARATSRRASATASRPVAWSSCSSPVMHSSSQPPPTVFEHVSEYECDLRHSDARQSRITRPRDHLRVRISRKAQTRTPSCCARLAPRRLRALLPRCIVKGSRTKALKQTIKALRRERRLPPASPTRRLL